MGREGAAAARFSESDLALLHAAKILGVRSGTEHRYTGVWVVVVERRVFVRSWNGKPTGWYHAFLAEPAGSISAGERELPVQARRVRSDRLRHAISRAFAEKYPTRASEKWVLGFAEPARETRTLELVPHSSGWR
ncbi:MAG: nitroreductase/quinone reductase family protein [Gemmatimonadota bacterium]